MPTRTVPASVHSTGTTASAPRGSGAPVMIRTALPCDIAGTSRTPAGRSPTTGRTTGAASLAPVRSAATTA